MVAYTAQRLQTNADWRAQFRFTGVDLTDWTLVGRALSDKGANRYVDLSVAGGQLTIDDAETGTFTVDLTAAESLYLREGLITFEILRTDPEPRRPVLRFTIKNHKGVAA